MATDAGPPRTLGWNWVTYVIFGIPIGMLLAMALAVAGIIPRTAVLDMMQPLSIGMVAFGVILWVWQKLADR